jgi:hypothetical protein
MTKLQQVNKIVIDKRKDKTQETKRIKQTVSNVTALR